MMAVAVIIVRVTAGTWLRLQGALLFFCRLEHEAQNACADHKNRCNYGYLHLESILRVQKYPML